MITASGARFGFQRTLPHVVGVALGVGVIAAVTGIGIGAVLAAHPALALGLEIIASVWILWMAFNLWQADPARTKERERPFRFIEAVLFQWINPKVWAVALSATAYVATLAPVDQATRLALTFSTVNIGVCLFWATAGSFLAYLLTNPTAWRVFMRTMAVALCGFSVLVFL